MGATCHLRSVQMASKEGAEVGQAGAGLLKLPQAPPGYKRLDQAAFTSLQCEGENNCLYFLLLLKEFKEPFSVQCLNENLSGPPLKFFFNISCLMRPKKLVCFFLFFYFSSLIHLMLNLHVFHACLFRNIRQKTNTFSNIVFVSCYKAFLVSFKSSLP